VIRTELRPYQDVAARSACAYDGFALFPEQRTGKCLISLAIVDRIRPEALVIICPKKAVLTWEEELDLHLDMDWDCEVYILTYQELVKNLKLRKQWYRWSKEFVEHDGLLMVIADEAHYIKKPGTSQSRVVRTLGKRAFYRLALTGTPIDKNYEQFWATMDFIQHGVAFPPTSEGFKKIYCNYETVFNKSHTKSWPELVGYNYEKKMREIIAKYSYRVTFNEARIDIGKPPVRIHRRKVKFDLTKASRSIYNDMKEDLEVVIDDLEISAPLPITLIQKLQQICGGFLLHQIRIPGEKKKKRIVVPVGDEKLTTLMQILSGMGKEKVVICCRFTHEIVAIREKFDEFEWTYKEISGSSEWDGVFDVDFVILQVKSGLGFDLSESATLVFYSWDHSYITFEQSRMRIMNMETTTKVNYLFLIARDTIEEEYYEAISRKKDFATLVLDKHRREREKPARKGARRIRKAGARA
jgi:SNF2 family DNA or RNA helicase